jgi:hypothetical protein
MHDASFAHDDNSKCEAIEHMHRDENARTSVRDSQRTSRAHRMLRDAPSTHLR